MAILFIIFVIIVVFVAIGLGGSDSRASSPSEVKAKADAAPVNYELVLLVDTVLKITVRYVQGGLISISDYSALIEFWDYDHDNNRLRYALAGGKWQREFYGLTDAECCKLNSLISPDGKIEIKGGYRNVVGGKKTREIIAKDITDKTDELRSEGFTVRFDNHVDSIYFYWEYR